MWMITLQWKKCEWLVASLPIYNYIINTMKMRSCNWGVYITIIFIMIFFFPKSWLEKKIPPKKLPIYIIVIINTYNCHTLIERHFNPSCSIII